MKTLRALGENMEWLIKCIKFGKEHGIFKNNKKYNNKITLKISS